jgi:psiF repeat
MRFPKTLMLSAFVVLIGSSATFAQPAPTTKPAATKPAAAAPDADKKAVSKACSDQATAKGLHGKERKAFRSECKRNGGKPA